MPIAKTVHQIEYPTAHCGSAGLIHGRTGLDGTQDRSNNPSSAHAAIRPGTSPILRSSPAARARPATSCDAASRPSLLTGNAPLLIDMADPTHRVAPAAADQTAAIRRIRTALRYRSGTTTASMNCLAASSKMYVTPRAMMASAKRMVTRMRASSALRAAVAAKAKASNPLLTSGPNRIDRML